MLNSFAKTQKGHSIAVFDFKNGARCCSSPEIITGLRISIFMSQKRCDRSPGSGAVAEGARLLDSEVNILQSNDADGASGCTCIRINGQIQTRPHGHDQL